MLGVDIGCAQAEKRDDDQCGGPASKVGEYDAENGGDRTQVDKECSVPPFDAVDQFYRGASAARRMYIYTVGRDNGLCLLLRWDFVMVTGPFLPGGFGHGRCRPAWRSGPGWDCPRLS